VYATDADWSALEIAGAFVVGAVLGALAVIRVARVLVNLFESDPHPPRRDPPAPDD